MGEEIKDFGLIAERFNVELSDTEDKNFCAICEALPRKQKSGEWVRETYFLFLTHPHGTSGKYKPIRLKSDGIKLERKRTEEHPFSLKETIVTLTCYSEQDRMFYPYSTTLDDKAITLEIYRNNKENLFYAGQLVKDNFFEPFSFEDGYFTELTFSDFACLEDCGYISDAESELVWQGTGEINLYDLLEQAVARAFVWNIRKPPLIVPSGCTIPFEKGYTIKRSLWGYKDDVRMYEIVQSILKSFCLIMEQRDGAIYLYDLSCYSKLPTEELFAVSNDAKLETIERNPRVKFKFDSPERIGLTDSLRDGMKRDGSKLSQSFPIYRFDAETPILSHYEQFESREDDIRTGKDSGSLWYRIKPIDGAKYDHAIAVLYSSRNGETQGFYDERVKDNLKGAIASTKNKDCATTDKDRYVMETVEGFRDAQTQSRVGIHNYDNGVRQPFLSLKSDYLGLPELNNLGVELHGEMLISCIANHINDRISEKYIPKNVSASELGEASNQEELTALAAKQLGKVFDFTEVYMAGDVTLRSAKDGSAVARLYNYRWGGEREACWRTTSGGTLGDNRGKIPNWIQDENSFLPKEWQRDRAKQKRVRWRKEGEHFKDFLYSLTPLVNMELERQLGSIMGGVEKIPKWTKETEDPSYHLFIKLGDCYNEEGMSMKKWHKLRGFNEDDKEVFYFPLPSLIDVKDEAMENSVGMFYLEVKLFPYLVTSYKHCTDKEGKDGETKRVEIKVGKPHEQLDLKPKKVLYRCNDKPILSLVAKKVLDEVKGNEDLFPTEAKGWIGKEKDATPYENIDIPLMLENGDFHPLIRGWVLRGKFVYGWKVKDTSGKYLTQAERLLDNWMKLHGRRRRTIIGSYYPISSLCSVTPPDKKKTIYYIEEEATDILNNKSEIRMAELPTEETKGERV